MTVPESPEVQAYRCNDCQTSWSASAPDLLIEAEKGMQFIVELEPTTRVLVVHANGEGDSAAVYEMLRAIKASRDFQPAMPVLLNGLGTPYVPSAHEAETYPVLLASELPGSAIAVVTREGLAHTMARMLEPLGRAIGLKYRAFLTRDDAMRWLTAGG